MFLYIVIVVVSSAVGLAQSDSLSNITSITSNGTQTNITTIIDHNNETTTTTTTTTTPSTETTTTSTTPASTITVIVPISTSSDTTTTTGTTSTSTTTASTTSPATSAVTAPPASPGCPDGWFGFRKSCYYTGERFNGVNFFSALAFCRSFGPKAHMIELNDLEEYNHMQAIARNISWGDGPWIGMIRMFNDRRFVLPSLNANTQDSSFNKMIEDLAGNVGTGYNCGGMDKSGNQFGFWSCTPSGSPWCELEI